MNWKRRGNGHAQFMLCFVLHEVQI